MTAVVIEGLDADRGGRSSQSGINTAFAIQAPNVHSLPLHRPLAKLEYPCMNRRLH